MIKINTYFKQGDEFIEYKSFEGSIDDIDYIEGAIELSIYGVELINVSMWDYIDQLWSYITDALLSISDNEPFETYFPDQPIQLKFKPVGKNMVEIEVLSGKKVNTVIDKNELVNTLKLHAIDFFKTLSKFTQGGYEQAIEDLERL